MERVWEEDWAERFFDYAGSISDEKMQSMWVRILAGEIEKPGSFSLKTLNIIRNIDRESASFFEEVAGYVLRDPSDSMSFIPHEVFAEAKWPLAKINRLVEFGLISPSGIGPVANAQYEVKADSQNAALLYADKVLRIVTRKAIQFNIVSLTNAGHEILKLIGPVINTPFLYKFSDLLRNEGATVSMGDIEERSGEDIIMINQSVLERDSSQAPDN